MLCCRQIETSQLMCCANQLTGFYIRAILTINWLKFSFLKKFVVSVFWEEKIEEGVILFLLPNLQ